MCPPHPDLVLLVGPIHDGDDPPQYQCQTCHEIVCITIRPLVIGVVYGKPDVQYSKPMAAAAPIPPEE